MPISVSSCHAVRWCCVVSALQWQHGAGGTLAMHRFSQTGQIAINKGYAVLLNGKPIGLNGFNLGGIYEKNTVRFFAGFCGQCVG